MAQKDITEKALEGHNDVFADIVNNLLFDGNAVVKESALQNARAHEPYRSADKTVRDQERDTCKLWTNNVEMRLAYLGIENETEAEDDMPFRVIGYDGASYRDQISYQEDVTMCEVLDRVENRGKQSAILQAIQNVKESLGVTTEKAMDILKIAQSDRVIYDRLLTQ